ncbi:MAG: tetratricopeptide repeat protein [Bacteroidota bacterium]|nr:tetratricopeptide repeat protein [Bacteroidota bacterium]
MLVIFSTLLFSCDNREPADKEPVNKPQAEKRMDSVSAEISKARAFQQKGQYEQALAITDSMIKQFPGQLDALTIKAEILKLQNKPVESLALLEKAYSLQPRDKELAYDLAYEYADLKNLKVLALTDTLIKYDKTETVARAWYVKATYYNNLGKEKEALRYYDSSKIADFNFLDAYLDQGQLLFKQKKYEAALKTFAIAQKISPATADFYFWVAKTQEALGQKQDAKTNYKRAYALDKSMTEAKQAADRL